MKVLFTAGREPSYTRNEVLVGAIQRKHELVLAIDEDRSYARRLVKVLWKLPSAIRQKPDVIFVGFYGQILMPWVRLLSRKPIILDAFISTYQTLCFDRKKFKPTSIPGKLAYQLDKTACKLADKVILDTAAHCDYYATTYRLPREKFSAIYVGANETMFHPMVSQLTHDVPVIFTYTPYQALHGTDCIVRAAALIGSKAQFVIAGSGKGKPAVVALAEKLETTNITFLDWVPYQKLPKLIADADICLGGHFGATEKANMVIAGKSFQFMAMQKPTILTRTTANLELFSADEPFMANINDPEDLAATLLKLIDDPALRATTAKRQHDVYTARASNEVIAAEIDALLGHFAPKASA